MKKGRTLIQQDARHGTIRIQKYGQRQFQTEIWAPEAGWTGIASFSRLVDARTAFAASLERLGGEAKPKRS
jgi:hypothetical protein